MNQSEDGRKEKPPKAVISGFKRFSPICRRLVVAETGIEPVRQRLRILSPLRLPVSSFRHRSRSTKKGNQMFPLLQCSGAGDESRTRDLNLGKVALYQLSYSRRNSNCLEARGGIEPP